MNPYHPDIVNTCSACAFFYKPHGCDLFGRDTDKDAPMCPKGDARPSPSWYGNNFDDRSSIDEDPDAFGRADE